MDFYSTFLKIAYMLLQVHIAYHYKSDPFFNVFMQRKEIPAL